MFFIYFFGSTLISALLVYGAYLLGLDQIWLFAIAFFIIGLGIKKGEKYELTT